MTMKTLFRSSNMAKKALLLGLSLLIITLVSDCTTWKEKYSADFPVAQCLPSFPDKDGWYGGDGAYSITLDKERTLWLFGDTFVSREAGRKDRIGMDAVSYTHLTLPTKRIV